MKIRIDDNSKEFIKAKDLAVEKALNALGVHLEGEAKEELENSPRRVDTGRLKGSITYATETEHSTGESPSWPADYLKHGTPEQGTVYVGTNVEYAPYIHEGSDRLKPNRFLKNAFTRNREQIKQYLEAELKNA